MKIIYAPKFVREYKKLPRKVQKEAEQREAIFRENPFDPRLDAHKLHGRFKDLWSFSIYFRFRIIFEFAEKDEVHFVSVGDHWVYQ